MRHGRAVLWWLEAEAIGAANDLHLEYDEDPTDRVYAIREACLWEDYTALIDYRDNLRLRLQELRAGV